VSLIALLDKISILRPMRKTNTSSGRAGEIPRRRPTGRHCQDPHRWQCRPRYQMIMWRQPRRSSGDSGRRVRPRQLLSKSTMLTLRHDRAWTPKSLPPRSGLLAMTSRPNVTRH